MSEWVNLIVDFLQSAAIGALVVTNHYVIKTLRQLRGTDGFSKPIWLRFFELSERQRKRNEALSG